MKHLLTQILLQDLRGEQLNVPECYCRVYTTVGGHSSLSA